ncbi:MAG: hypothetical protein HUJ58_07805 [Erysipelotrichaceae bacterium]|nr:hypothetical protein [Erysipelotrichaceae bacterium]
MRILVVCGGGISTSIIVEEMKNYAGADDVIKAIPMFQLNNCIDSYDIVFAAPQIEYAHDQIKELCHDKHIAYLPIPDEVYGSMDGEQVIRLARECLVASSGQQTKEKSMKTLKITLACAGGVSTSILCSKIIAEAKSRGFDEVECKAYGAGTLTDELVAGSNVILLGPQVTYMEEDVVKRFPDYPVRVISMMDYGTMNARNIVNGLLKEFNW